MHTRIAQSSHPLPPHPSPYHPTDNHVAELFASARVAEIKRMVVNGYNVDLLEVYERLGGRQAMPKEAVEMCQRLPAIQVS